MLELMIAIVVGLVAQPAAPTAAPAARALRLLPGTSSSWVAHRPGKASPGPESLGTAPSLPGLAQRVVGSTANQAGEIDLEIARLKSRVVVIDPDTNLPLRRTGLVTEESLKLPFNRTFFLVGRVGANSGSLEQQQYKLVGTTGVGVKLPLGGELQMRRGRSMTNYDPDDLILIPEQAKDFLEFTTRWTLPGDVNLEFTHESIAPQTMAGRDTVRRDVRLAFPFSNSGKLHIGAKQQSSSALAVPWFDQMKVYFGLELKR